MSVGEADLTGLDVDELRELVERLDAERDQLAHALESRIVIEQAKGILAERYRLSVGTRFCCSARAPAAPGCRIHELAADVVRDPTTPQTVLRGMASDSRLRAIAMRERTELSAAERRAGARSKRRAVRPARSVDEQADCPGARREPFRRGSPGGPTRRLPLVT